MEDIYIYISTVYTRYIHLSTIYTHIYVSTIYKIYIYKHTIHTHIHMCIYIYIVDRCMIGIISSASAFN